MHSLCAWLPLLFEVCVAGVLKLNGDSQILFGQDSNRAIVRASCEADEAVVSFVTPRVVEGMPQNKVTVEFRNVPPTCTNVPESIPCAPHHVDYPALFYCAFNGTGRVGAVTGPVAAYPTQVKSAWGEQLAIAVRADCAWPSFEDIIKLSGYPGDGASVVVNVNVLFGPSRRALPSSSLHKVTITDLPPFPPSLPPPSPPSPPPLPSLPPTPPPLGPQFTLIMQIKAAGSIFNYDSSYWTDASTLNEQLTTETRDVDVKLPAFSTAPLNGLRICVDVASNCYTYWFGSASHSSAKTLFASNYIRTSDMGQEAFEDLFDRARANTPSSFHNQRANHRNCLQRPGVNTQCNDANRARFGFCGNLPSQPCQASDSDDSDFAIGIGCHGQNTPTKWGAGFNNYYAHDVVSPVGDKQFQAWLYAAKYDSRTSTGYETTYTTSG